MAVELPDIFHIEGKQYNQASLMELCRNAICDAGTPGWKKEIFEFLLLFLDLTKGEIIQKTSGTTGKPKEVPLHRDSMIRSAQRTLAFFKLKPGDQALLCLPVHYIAGKMMVVRALAGELDLVLAEPSGRPLMGLHRPVRFAAMVPLQVYESVKCEDNLSLVEHLIVGGGELHPSMKNQLEAMLSPAVYETFAMTETYTHFALKRINGSRPDGEFKLLEGVEINLDERGCLQVDIVEVTMGSVTTNDLVEINAHGDGFKWLGRIDNVINSGGIKVIPEVLELKMEKLLGHHCLLLPEKDVKLGNRLVLLVETSDFRSPQDIWFQQFQEHLSPYEVPKRIVVVDGLPRNSASKPDRNAARKLL